MSLQVRCLLCCKTFVISKNDTSALLLHIRQSHPEVSEGTGRRDALKVKSDESLIMSNSELDVPKRHVKEKLDKMPDQCQQQKPRRDRDPVKHDKVKFKGKKFCCFARDQRRRPPQRTRPPSKKASRDNLLSSSACQLPEPLPSETYMPQKTKVDTAMPAPCVCPAEATTCVAKSESGTKVLYTRKYKVKSPLHSKAPGSKKLYKTSIEKWRPGEGTIFCPNCGANKRPVIKSQADRVSPSSYGAACILSCWPCCFLPCIFPAPANEYLHCSECNHFLGTYDRKKAVIQPNEGDIKNADDMSSSKTISDIHIVQTVVNAN